MATHAETGRMSFEDYFAWEATQEMRHEFIDGEVFAMAGGSTRHGRVGINLVAEIRSRMQGQTCQPFGNDVKLFVRAANRSFYPDAFIVCDDKTIDERGVVEDATAIFEVLSPSTAAFDRGEKFAFYRLLPGLRHYVLLDPEALTVEAFEFVDGRWSLAEMDGLPADRTFRRRLVREGR